MTKKDYLEFHQKCCDQMKRITQAKNADYTANSDNPFSNFTRSEAFGITEAERGILVRMSDKLSRLVSFVSKGAFAVKDESLEDTCLDLANYAILLCAYMKSKKIDGYVPRQYHNVTDEAMINDIIGDSNESAS